MERDRDTTSQDSGISQMSAGGNDIRQDTGISNLEERMEELNIRQNYAAKSNISNKHTSSSLPYTVNGITDETNGISIEDIKDHEVIKKIKEIDTKQVNDKVKKEVLYQLVALIKKKHVQLIIENFKMILRILLELLEKEDSSVQLMALLILTEIFKCPELKQCYLGFVELLIVKVLNAHTDPNKDVSFKSYY